MAQTEHPLKAWLQTRGLSVVDFSKDRPFSYVTVYKLLKGEGWFSSDTLMEISDATDKEVSEASIIDWLRAARNREGAAA